MNLRTAILSLSAFSLLTCAAQTDDAANTPMPDDRLLRLDVEARVDWQQEWTDDHTDHSNSGFMPKFLTMRLDGSIIPGLTYSWRQRFNKQLIDGNFFRATDWIYINYDFKGWNFSAGKEVTAIGGYEYDANPIDAYNYSLFTNNISCYNLAATVGYHITPSDRLKFQASQSPFWTKDFRDLYAYNLMWEGQHGFFSSLYSANMVEYARGRFISYLMLGNKFTFGNVNIQLDLMNRAAAHQTFFFKDCSVVGRVDWRPARRWNVFAKMTYDVNKTHNNADFTVLPGTEFTMAGAGVEFFPLLKDRTALRLHADLFYAWGRNTNSADAMQNKSLLLNVGIKWNMNILSLKRK